MKHIDDMSETYINNYHKIIGLNVKRIRNEKGISQLDLAHKIGHKSVSIISCAEINHKNNHFNIEHLLKIAYVLEVDIAEFFKEIKE
ncbi:helix-turn-helix transcriptional regulator [Aliarcobacter butzleri]|uniref:helix-turn-helix domain-containing protein n=1 Tax=Aliarcobacter butzleri TaxID=28197 RepID=UPI001D004F10|nr:helix-turn-helix transcriptional regulator [Aliarcobacter butzleri]MCG3676501.1 helix-turn-helix transcriptional regulator [Aliarcobacter butzleri]MCT7585750.1 helix-turn-helix transcriptional regulator [Aliarcobacter butzleri]MCT7589536.1 helix-turn-helix transcriptional regulator [Aliarcobacter butzleri]MCT7602664.1 helix-turn-helix transcriptional regulator [Aliarcobacter butzleri]MCT7645439.1 helix-turn-helix transcriptional regulator [Aliarcobacter butzleri]